MVFATKIELPRQGSRASQFPIDKYRKCLKISHVVMFR